MMGGMTTPIGTYNSGTSLAEKLNDLEEWGETETGVGRVKDGNSFSGSIFVRVIDVKKMLGIPLDEQEQHDEAHRALDEKYKR